MWMLPLVAWAGNDSACAEVYDEAALIDAVAAAEAAFAALDDTGFEAALAVVHTRLACERARLGVPTVLRLHCLEVYASFLAGNTARLDQALAGARAIQPDNLFPAAVVPLGHPILARSSAADALLASPGAAPLQEPRPGWIEVNGRRATTAPAAMPALLQQFDARGRVVATRYRWPEEPWGAWGPGAPPQEPKAKAPRPGAERAGRLHPAVVAGAEWLSAGEPADAGPGAFGGVGPRLGARLDLSVGTAGSIGVEVGYRGGYGTPPGATEPDVAHLGYAVLLGAGHLGPLSLGVGPAATLGTATVTADPGCVLEGCTEGKTTEDLIGGETRWRASVTTVGGAARLGVRMFRLGNAAVSLEADVLATGDGSRLWLLPGLALTVGGAG